MAQSPLVALLSSSLVAYFLPSLLVKLLLTSLYSLRLLTPKPHHARKAYTFIVIAYVLYSLTSSWLQMPRNYYDLIGVAYPLRDPGTLRPNWLRLARAYHPDKAGGSEQAQETFRILQRANEVLKSDQLRKAYDRVGPSLLEKLPTSALSDRELFKRGLFASLGWYVMTLVVLVLLPLIRTDGKQKFFWRISLLLLLFSNELCLLASPPTMSYPLPHEIIYLLRQIYFNFNLLLTHLPFFQSDPAQSTEQRIYATVAPALASLGLRSQISEQNLDGVLRKEVSKRSGSKEAVIQRLAEEMTRL